MARPEVLAYLRDNLKKFPEDVLRHQLETEGVEPAEFDEALAELKNKGKGAKPKTRPPAAKVVARLLLVSGACVIAGAVLLGVAQKRKRAAAAAAAPPPVAMEQGFVGASGYVVRLPDGYAAVQSFQDERKTVERVHFCKIGTDPTNFLDTGLFGQLGIVRLTVQPSPIPDDLDGIDNLTRQVTASAQARGEKFTLKNIQVSSMRGVQLTYDTPFPRVEAYILGHNVLYSFLAGQDDEVYRTLLQSLRDARSET